MKTTIRVIALAAIPFFAVGCGNSSGPAEIPKNPVPMEKPGAGATPGGGGKGGALPDQQGVQPIK